MNKVHSKKIAAKGISGSIEAQQDSLTINVEMEETYIGTVFLIIPWFKKRKIKRKLIRTRNSRFMYEDGTDCDDLDDIFIDVLTALAIEAFTEFDDAYPEEIIDHVELSENEVFDVIDSIHQNADSTDFADIEETPENVAEDSAAELIADVLEETEQEIATDTYHEYKPEPTPYVEPEPTRYVAPEPEPTRYVEPEPTRYVAPEPEPTRSNSSYDSSSSSSSYDSSSSSSSSSSDSGSSDY